MRQHQPNQHKRSWSTSRRNLMAGAFLGMLFCADGFAYAGIINKGVPVKIMPVGDSITEGNIRKGDIESRFTRCSRTTAIPLPLSARKTMETPANDTGFSTGMEDPNHEGYGSARIGMLLNGATTERRTALPIKTSLANNNPDVVLILLGTNDILASLQRIGCARQWRDS
jgi:hypothetical protein